jgi:hypothetical protein
VRDRQDEFGINEGRGAFTVVNEETESMSLNEIPNCRPVKRYGLVVDRDSLVSKEFFPIELARTRSLNIPITEDMHCHGSMGSFLAQLAPRCFVLTSQ